MNLKQAAWFSAVPWSMMAFTGYIAGFWSDLLIRRGTSITLTRKIMQVRDSCVTRFHSNKRSLRLKSSVYISE